MNIENYIKSNKWISIIEYVLKYYPESFVEWINDPNFSVQQAPAEFHEKIGSFILNRAHNIFYDGIEIFDQEDYDLNYTKQFIHQKIYNILDSFDSCINNLINSTLEGTRANISFTRINALRFMFALSASDGVINNDVSFSIEDANSFMVEISESPLSPRNINEAIILAGLNIGLSYSEILAIQLMYSEFEKKQPITPNDNIENQTGNIYEKLLQSKSIADILAILNNPEYQSLFSKNRNTPYFVAFCSDITEHFPSDSYLQTIRRFKSNSPKYSLSEWEVLHFNSFVMLSNYDTPFTKDDNTDDIIPSYTISDLFKHITAFVFDKKDVKAEFKKLYHRYYNNDAYPELFPNLQVYLHSGNLDSSNEDFNIPDTELSNFKLFLYMVYEKELITSMRRETYRICSLNDPTDSYFSEKELNALVKIFPTAFISLDRYTSFIKHTQHEDPPAGLLLLQILKNSYSTDFDNNSKEYSKFDYNNMFLDSIHAIDFTDFDRTIEIINNIMIISGYSKINTNDNFQRLIIDTLKDVVDCFSNSSSDAIQTKFFQKLYIHLKLSLNM